MRAMHLNDSRRPAVEEGEIPQPQPRPDELLIRVYAAGLTPTELLWYPTSHQKDGGARHWAVPGHEFSGVVAAAGKNVTGFEPGQEVYGFNDWFADGAMAEYCLTRPDFIAPKPASLTHLQAASVPIGALTAWQGLFDRARLKPGERVLVQGGAGAVGLFAVQLARYGGAHVAATASQRNLDFISRLGAEEAIDYRAVRFEERVSGVDVVFDTVGGETLARSWSVLKPGGRMVTIATGGDQSPEERVRQAFFIVAPNAGQLAEIGRLFDAGHLQAVVDAGIPFADAPRAYAGWISHRQGRGKIVVAVSGFGRSAGSAESGPDERLSPIHRLR